MSANKMKYWEVNTTYVVKATNKTEALQAVKSRKRVPNTEILATTVSGDRIPAAEAHALVAETV